MQWLFFCVWIQYIKIMNIRQIHAFRQKEGHLRCRWPSFLQGVPKAGISDFAYRPADAADRPSDRRHLCAVQALCRRQNWRRANSLRLSRSVQQGGGRQKAAGIPNKRTSIKISFYLGRWLQKRCRRKLIIKKCLWYGCGTHFFLGLSLFKSQIFSQYQRNRLLRMMPFLVFPSTNRPQLDNQHCQARLLPQTPGAGEKRNSFNQQFRAERTSQIRGSDVTCFKPGERYLCTCAIIGLFSRKIIAHKVSKKNSIQLITSTFKMAWEPRSPESGPIFHSDRGAQYTFHSFQRLLHGAASLNLFSLWPSS